MGSDGCDPFTDERLTLAGLLFEASAALGSLLERALDDAGLSRQWFELLVRLARSPDQRLRMSDLAAQTTLTASGLTRAIDRMEAAGLVERAACPSDRRGLFAILTDEGLRRVQAALPAHLAQIDAHLVDVFSPDERARLERLLRKLRDHVHPYAEAGTRATVASAARDG